MSHTVHQYATTPPFCYTTLKVERWSLLKHWIRLYALLVEHEVSHTVNSCLTFKYLNGFNMHGKEVEIVVMENISYSLEITPCFAD